MCIRDRDGNELSGFQELIAVNDHVLTIHIQGPVNICTACQYLLSVSYTHLDVYKRQVQSHALGPVPFPDSKIPFEKANGFTALS